MENLTVLDYTGATSFILLTNTMKICHRAEDVDSMYNCKGVHIKDVARTVEEGLERWSSG